MLSGLTGGQRAEPHRRVAGHLGMSSIRRPGGRPHALGSAGSIGLVCMLLREHDRAFNASVSPIRAAVERTISRLQSWKILITRFRPPRDKFPAAPRATAGMHLLRWTYE